LAIADITIFPVGTDSTSISKYVAEIEKALGKEQGRVKIKLTPMSTLIEGDIHDLFEIIEKLHEIPFSNGIKRVETNIRIDDRRDKQLTMEGKLASVAEKLDQ
jgi:uncharacterized protein (TIGR00106 family)